MNGKTFSFFSFKNYFKMKRQTVKVNHVVKIIEKHLAFTNWPKDDELVRLPAVARKARMMIQ